MNDRIVYYILLGLAILVSAKIYFSSIYPVVKQIIRIHLTPTGLINTLSMDGQVEIVGKADGKTFLSPFAQTPCVLWQVGVQQLAPKRGWIQIDVTASSESFYVNDRTGAIQVLPAGAQILFSDNRESSNAFPMERQTMPILKKLGIDTTNYSNPYKTIRMLEHLIETDEKIYILGEIEYRHGIKTIVTTDIAPMIISDHSQRKLLGKLYRDVAVRLFFLLSLMYFLFGYINS